MHHSPSKNGELNLRLDRLKAALATVAQQLEVDPVYAPIFERLELEIAVEEARGDSVARARAIVALQRFMA